MKTEVQANTLIADWKHKYKFDLSCPQLPFRPDEAPRQPPWNKKQSGGHLFNLVITVMDQDSMSEDDVAGTVHIPILDIMQKKYNGRHTLPLQPAGKAEVLLWWCQQDDAQCKTERARIWEADNLKDDRVQGRQIFDCRQGCHSLLELPNGPLIKYVSSEKSKFSSRIGSWKSAKKKLSEAEDARLQLNKSLPRYFDEEMKAANVAKAKKKLEMKNK